MPEWHHEHMLRTVAVLNQKGGVGKTTVTLGLASAAAAAGRRVLVVDLDPQASSTWVLGIDPERPLPSSSQIRTANTSPEQICASDWSDLIDVLPANVLHQEHMTGDANRLRNTLAQVHDEYEVILIDCPPSLGGLTRSALTAARHALVVVEPSALGLRGIGGVADMIDEVWDTTNPALELSGVILNRVPAVSSEADRRIAELALIVGSHAIWNPPVPQRVVFNQAIGERRPIHSYGSRAREPIDAFDRLWRRLRQTLRDA